MDQNGFVLRWGGILFFTSLSYFSFRLYKQRTFFRNNVDKYNLVSRNVAHLDFALRKGA